MVYDVYENIILVQITNFDYRISLITTYNVP